MGQSQDCIVTLREPYDETGDNGFILGNKYIPEELLAEFLCHVDNKTLLNCQLVCKRWKILIHSYVWRKKAEMTLNRPHTLDTDMPWKAYYMIAKKRPFEKNLIKNHSGEYGVQKYWKIFTDGGDHWKVENPPCGVPPIPKNVSVFEKKEYCFVTSYNNCSKMQLIDLEAEGLLSYVLDVLQPTIVVSEWYSCRWDCPAHYECTIELLRSDNKVMKTFQFHDDIEGDKQNQWLNVSHEFKDYGLGLKKISFYHGGMDKSFWAGHYGSKMAGACVIVKIPENDEHRCEEDTDTNTDTDTDTDTDTYKSSNTD
ncbi:F-box only protein 44-like [Vespa velutina]|uniref:F-box only protein 44-like n=1 Tax=Vespa velutina TaxID=202808 RepID=UPI001FB37C30|nr:F-box only protein 44-like [Vespa velutina]XP_047365012.1 F-box only protein 44-like [Vespa velutina]XP_047365013.1 F-box only protein 44-like [Vespa velutina]